VLDHVECRQLLESHYVGRIGLSVAALPVIVPVNYTVDGDRIVICSAPGTKLDAARHGLVACLEIDDFDPFDHAGWSVLVTGTLTDVTDPSEISRLGHLPLTPWVAMVERHFLVLSTELVTGRRLRRS
jgi:nitroimidazol reductase NimA-like FMN-containing flavoprotein (pyridoxamine 5'-phosphate oxidase superfamily)